MTPAYQLDELYDGVDAAWGDPCPGLTYKYAVVIGGYRTEIPAEAVFTDFGWDIAPNAEDWAAEHRRLGRPVPPIPHATRERTWWDRIKDTFRGTSQNVSVPRAMLWSSDIGDFVTDVVPVLSHKDGIPIVVDWIAADLNQALEEEAKLVAEFEREQRNDDDGDGGGKRGRRGRRRREPISLDDDDEGGAPAPF